MTRAVAIVAVLAATACTQKGDKPSPPVSTDPSHIAIDVTRDGFTPENISVPQGKPVTLVFDRKTDDTCAKEVVLEVDGKKIQKDLPLDTPVELAITFPKAGKLTYSCAMDMEHGTITVQ